MSFLKFLPVNPSSKCPLVISRIFPWPFEPPEKHENVYVCTRQYWLFGFKSGDDFCLKINKRNLQEQLKKAICYQKLF